MLGEEPIDAGDVRTAGHFIERSVAFGEGDYAVDTANNGQQLTETPDTALVHGKGGGAALLPEVLHAAGIGQADRREGFAGTDAPWVDDLVEAVAVWAAEVAA